jgi:tRNA threonylcarbamoyladenosine biosynthesis protein TsaE
MIFADAAATDQFGRALAGVLRAGDVILLSGTLGAGKTSLARGILAARGLSEEAPSPSYNLVIPYDLPQVDLPIWHVDLYRLEAPDQVEELGLDDALIDGVLIIEWPDRLGTRRWDQALSLSIEILPDDTRSLTANVPSSWKDRWLFQ